MARVTSVVGHSRSSISVLTERFHLAPGAAREAEAHALPGLAFAADDLADALELLRHALVGGDDVVEGVGDLAEDAVCSPGMRTEKSPARIACRACRRFCNSSGEPGAELSSSDLPGRFFGTPLAIFFVSDRSWLHRRLPNSPPSSPRLRAAGAIGGDKVRTAWSAPDQLEAALPWLFAVCFGTEP